MAKTKKTVSTKETTTARKAPIEKTTRTGGRADQSMVTVDRRASNDRRSYPDRRKTGVAVAVEQRKLQRRAKVNRRRQIDPTTCERDYSEDEVEFMNALDQYKRASGRMFPTCSEVLEVLRGLGYMKLNKADQANQPLSWLASHQASEQTAG